MTNFILDETKFNEMQTKIIKKCIEDGFNPEGFANPEYSWMKMQVAAFALRNGHDLSQYMANYDLDQLDVIRAGLMKGIDISKYTDPKLSYDEMNHIYLTLMYDRE